MARRRRKSIELIKQYYLLHFRAKITSRTLGATENGSYNTQYCTYNELLPGPTRQFVGGPGWTTQQMRRRTFLSGLGTVALGGVAGVGTATAASTDGYEIELYPGDTVYFAETSRLESFIYAPLQDGSTYYMFQTSNGCCDVDTVVMVLAETGEVLYLESLDGVLYTEDQIGEMADRIGEMADRIVYTEELIVQTEHLIVDVIRFSQENLLTFVSMLNPLNLL